MALMLDINLIKKDLMIPKEKKEEMFKKNYKEKLNEYEKMKEIYEMNKNLYNKK